MDEYFGPDEKWWLWGAKKTSPFEGLANL